MSNREEGDFFQFMLFFIPFMSTLFCKGMYLFCENITLNQRSDFRFNLYFNRILEKY
jgi:hypothetical protein